MLGSMRVPPGKELITQHADKFLRTKIDLGDGAGLQEYRLDGRSITEDDVDWQIAVRGARAGFIDSDRVRRALRIAPGIRAGRHKHTAKTRR